MDEVIEVSIRQASAKGRPATPDRVIKVSSFGGRLFMPGLGTRGQAARPSRCIG
jgi:hypothetical protein